VFINLAKPDCVAFKVHAILVCVEISKLSSLDLITSKLGSEANVLISSTVNYFSPIAPPSIFRFSLSLAKSTNTLDVETGSSEYAMDVGPTNNLSSI